MSTPPPKIDLRTYADLVANTEWLAQGFTGYGFLILKSPLWEPSENLVSFTIVLSTPASADALPNSGRNLVVVGKIGDSYHLRIFDVKGEKAIDPAQEKFSPDDSLRDLLEKCFNLQAKNQPIDEADKRNLLSQLAFPKEGKGPASFTIVLSTPASADVLPREGRNLVVVGKIGDFYHLRIFNINREKFIDAGWEEFSPDDSLRKLLERCFNLQQPLGEADERNLLSQLAFPEEGKGLVVVGKDKNSYRIRIFDWTGQQIVDKDKFKPDETLLQQLEDALNRQSNNQLDNQSKSKLLKQIQTSLDLPPSRTPSSQWIPAIEGKPDAGGALIRIFGRMVSQVSDRLNRVPEKHFLTFLDLIGTQIQPPQPARVPLTFALVERNEDSPNLETIVPAGTQVAAAASDGQAEVVFETEQDLVATSTQLQAVYVRQPDVDKYSDRTDLALGKKPGAFPAFAGEEPIEHCLYLALEDQLIALPGDETLTLTFDTSQATALNTLLGGWSYWDGKNWTALTVASQQTQPTSNPTQVQVKIEKLPPLQQTTVGGKTAAWLRVLLLKPNSQNPTISRIQTKVEATGLELLPDRCLLNTSAIDLSKDFFPFGEQPRFNDTLYLAHARIFAIPGATVTLDITLTEPANHVMPLVWEVWNGKKWTDEITPKPTGSPTEAIRWSQNGTITLTLPPSFAATKVNDESNFWIRVRVNQLNYGNALPSEPAMRVVSLTESPETTNANKKVLKVSEVRGFLKGDRIQILGGSDALEIGTIDAIDPPTKTLTLATALTKSYVSGASVILQIASNPTLLQAPLVKTLKITRYDSGNRPLVACKTSNDFQFVDRTIAANSPATDDAFQPFVPTADPTKPTLYLGFDQPFANRSIALYAQLAAATAEEIRATQPLTNPPRLVWEYSATDNRWVTLNVQDGTASFSQRGLVRFIGPADFRPRQEFGQSLYWLRVRWTNADTSRFRIVPRVQRWLTNTVWATQSTTLRDEILGSSDGNPDQRFHALQVPILLGHRLEVQESAFLPPGEVAALQQQAPDDVTVLQDDIGQIEAIWVRWQEVPDFCQSTPHDRHYLLDRLTGEIRFGDGQNGRIPPQGRQNIRLTHYRTGGGDRGNLPAYTINQLKTTIPYIDQVTNLEPAAGGSEQESLEQVQERGPKSLRHRDKAVTVQDFEDLTFAASTDIARVLAIVPTFSPSTTTPKASHAGSLGPLDQNLWFDPTRSIDEPDRTRHNTAKNLANLPVIGQVQVMIVPRSSDAQPIPSLALVEQVETYLRSRCTPAVKVQVIGPPWVQVSVTATVVPQSLEVADGLAQIVRQRLDQFLHPLTGGVAGQGWQFGREPHESDLYRVIEAIAQVSYVQSLSLQLFQNADASLVKLVKSEDLPDHFLVYSGNHSITLL